MNKCNDYSVLFVCTGNIFRSMTAEYALRQTLGIDSGIHIHSAGLIDAPHEIVGFVREYLNQKGIDVTAHTPRKLTTELLACSELAVAMDFDHRLKVQSIFNRQLPLFSEVAFGTVAPMLDVYEVVPDWRNNESAAAEYGQNVMDTIFDGMSGFVKRMPDFARKSS